MNKNTVLGKIFLPYVLMVIVPMVLIGVFTVSYLFAQINNQIERLTVNLLDRSGDTVDAELRNINSIAYQASVNSKVLDFATTEYKTIGEKGFYADMVCSELSKSNMYINLFDNVSIYFSKNNCIVDMDMMYTPQDYFNTYFHQTNISFEYWFSGVANAAGIRFIPTLEVSRSRDKSVSILTYIQPLFGGGDERAVLVATISSDRLLSSFNKAFENDTGYFAAVDLSGNVVAYSRELPFTVTEEMADYRKSGDYYFSADGEKYMCLVSKSNVVGLSYLYLMPQSEVLRDAISVRRSFSVMLFIVILFAAFIIFVNTKIKFTPIQNMANRVRNKTGARELKSLKTLDTFMGSVLDENEQLSDIIRQQKETIKNRFLSRLLWNSSTVTDKEAEEYQQNFGADFTYSSYCAMIIGPVNTSRGGNAEAFSGEYQIIDIVRSCQSGVKAEVIPGEGNALVYIINGEPQRLRDFTYEVCEAVTNAVDNEIIVAVGTTVNKLSQFSKTYEEAVAAVTYAEKNNRCGLIYSSDLDADINEGMYYPSEKEMALISAVKTGDSAQAGAILDEIYDRNFNNPAAKRDENRCLIYSMVSTGIRIVNESKINNAQSKSEFVDMCRSTVREHDLPKAYRELADRLMLISGIIADMPKEPAKGNYRKIEDKIRAYLDEHYMDKDISLLKLSEELGYSYKYLSNIFKDIFGKKFTEYINGMRLEEAKRLLEQTDITVSQAADRVGYLSDGTFIKAFKKRYGVTPSKLREL